MDAAYMVVRVKNPLDMLQSSLNNCNEVSSILKNSVFLQGYALYILKGYLSGILLVYF